MDPAHKATFSLPDKPLVGMVHLAALPGSPGSKLTLHAIIRDAIRDARRLAEAGFDAVLVENFGDTPFHPGRVDAHTTAAMTVVARAVREAIALPMGINVLRNDPQAALAVACCCAAGFIRVNVHAGVYATDQGLIEGRADETLRYRQRLGTTTAIWADVHVKHARPLWCPDIAKAARDTAYRGGADGLIVSGPATGQPTDLDDVRQVRAAVPDRPILVGSGASANNVREIITLGCGVIVGTSIKEHGVTTAPVDPRRAGAFVEASRG
jgi:membrane complex biogenesis BtpA family protein